MTKINLEKQGIIQLPEHYRALHRLETGAQFVVETNEGGLALYLVKPDVERAYIELTSFCNLDCAMCIRHSWQDPQGSMSVGTFHAVLEGLRAFPNLKRVFIGGFGEPLIHPHIVEMVAQIHALGVGVTMTTNALLLKKPLAEALFRAGIDTLVVSLDSMHVQAYHKKVGSKALNTVLNNIEDVQQLIRDAGWKLPALGLEFVATKSNLEDLYKLPNIAKQVGASFVIVTNLVPHVPEMANEILYECGEPLQLGGGWGYHRAGWVAWGFPKLPRMRWGSATRCRFTREPALVIGWDGCVSPCYALMHSYSYYIFGRHKDVKRYALGNVNEKSLLDIWTSEEYVIFRAKVNDFRFPSCVDCGIACSFAEENIDCWGNDPSCADCLWAQDILLCA